MIVNVEADIGTVVKDDVVDVIVEEELDHDVADGGLGKVGAVVELEHDGLSVVILVGRDVIGDGLVSVGGADGPQPNL